MMTVANITKYYGDKLGVSDVSFSIEEGEIIGLLGPNGAGKSTIMKMIAGYMLPTSGRITLDGVNIIENPSEAGKIIGYMPEIPPLYGEMSVEYYLRFLSEIRKVPRAKRSEHLKEVMAITNISNVKDRLIKNLSKGYRQRVGLAQALIGNPKVLILDEPTVGLDPHQITEVRNLIARLSRDHTIILSSHILSEITMMCKRIIIINQGHLLVDDSLEHLEHGEADRWIVRVKADPALAQKVLADIPDVISVEKMETNGDQDQCAFKVAMRNALEVRERIFFRLAEAGMPLLELRSAAQTLEEVFIDLTTRQVAEPAEFVSFEEETA